MGRRRQLGHRQQPTAAKIHVAEQQHRHLIIQRIGNIGFRDLDEPARPLTPEVFQALRHVEIGGEIIRRREDDAALRPQRERHREKLEEIDRNGIPCRTCAR